MTQAVTDEPGSGQGPAVSAEADGSHEPAHSLRCLEIWGGNTAVETHTDMPGINIGIYSRPSRGEPVGGDMYYLSMCSAGAIGRFVLADLCGHGEAVAPAGTMLRDLMRRHINTPDQSRLARAISGDILTRQATGFATAILATYYAPTQHLVLVNAGHPPPLHYSAGRDEWAYIEPDRCDIDARRALRNLPLGIVDGTEYEQFAIRLERGDEVILYTDAFPEARISARDRLGMDGLLKLAGSLNVAAARTGEAPRLHSQLVAAVSRESVDGSLHDDDATVISLEHTAAARPPASVAERIRQIGRMLGLGRVIDSGPGVA